MRSINLHMQGGGGRRCGASLTDDNAAYGDLECVSKMRDVQFRVDWAAFQGDFPQA